jgi:hypothetical protein
MVDTCLDCCAIFSCRVEMALRPDVLIIFPSRRALTPPAPSLHRVRSVAFPRLTGTTHWLRLLAILPTRLRCRRRAVPRLRLLLRSAPSWTPRLRGLDHLCNAARSVGIQSGRSRELPGSCKTLACVPRSLTPADRSRLAFTARPMLPSAQKTTSAPHSLSFRGSITRPARPLCTLRSRGHPRTTQHSVPAGRYPFAGAGLSPAGFTRRFRYVDSFYTPSSFSRLNLAHFPRKRPSWPHPVL